VLDVIGGWRCYGHDTQDVQRVEVAVPVFDGELAGLGEDLMGAAAQQAGDVQRTPGTGRALPLQVTGEELVERIVAGANRSEKCSHETSV
jgi:hypothetical protein